MQYLKPLKLDRQTLEGIVEHTLDKAHQAGATAVEVAASSDAGLSVSVRMGEIETLEHHRDKGLGLTLYFGQRKGNASTADFSDTGISEAIAAASAIARFTADDPYAGLPDVDLLAHHYPDLDLDHPWDINPQQAVDLAQQCESAAREYDPRITNSEGANINSFRGTMVYGNSLGFIGGYAGTRHSVSCSVVGEQDGAMQRDYWYDTSRVPEDLADVVTIGQRAGERTVRRLGGRRLSTREIPVLFEADVARSLIGHFVAAIRGPALYRKASFLQGQLGQRIFPEFVSLREQPHLPRALGSVPFDGEGVATQEQDVVSDGILRNYILDSYSARRLGMQTTGNAGGVHNLSVLGGSFDFPGLLREMDTGLLVTELIGYGINLVTGDYSRGAVGFWVEHGEIQYPVEEITIAGNLQVIFQSIRAMGTDVDRRGNILTGSLLIDRMIVAGE